MKKSKSKIQLTHRQKILGAKYCYENAVSLYEEATILINNSKWARATAISILGIEEVSKVEFIGQTFFYRTQNDWEKFESKFQNHNEKLRLADILLLQSAYQSNDNKRLEEEIKDILKGRNLNIGKQRCFYVGLSKDNLWEVPLDKVTKEDALYCKKLLEVLLEPYKNFFDKPYNEIVDLIKQMKKAIPSEQVRISSEKMQLHIKQKSDIIKTKI